MPDGTKLNRGKGFDYQGMSLGFYMDADVLVGDKGGYNSGLHTNDDDYMKYYYEFFELNNERLSVSLAMVGDYDGFSGIPAMQWMMRVQEEINLVLLRRKCWTHHVLRLRWI